MTSRQSVIIIGAGVGGLATANLLAKAGYTVSIYEQLPGPGGRTGRLIKDGFSFDTGASWLLMKQVFAQYYQLLSTTLKAELQLTRLDPAYKVFFENQPAMTIHSDLKRDAASFEAIEAGAGERLQRYVGRSRQIYDLSLAHFLYSNFKSPRAFLNSKIIKNSLPMLKLATQSIHHYVASGFKDRRLQQILEYQMVFLGVSPYKAPAIYNLMSALDFEEGVFYPQGGLYSFIESLTKIGRQLGVNYHYASPVSHINSQAGRATGISLADGSFVPADIVISNADLHYTETSLLNPADRTYPASYWAAKTAAPSAILLYLGIKGALPEFAHHSLLFVDAWKQNFDDLAGGSMPQTGSIYICKASASDTTIAPVGYENIFVLIPAPAGVTMDKTAEAKYADQYLEQIKRMTGVDLVGRTVSRTSYGPSYFGDELHSWQSSMLGPAHSLRQSAMFRTPNKSRKLSNLYYVGASTRPGIGLPMCLISAQLIYKQLIGDRSSGPLANIKPVGQSSPSQRPNVQ